MTKVSTVILVHGAWADGSSWAKIIPLLKAKGVRSVAVQLPLNAFADDVATVKRAIALADGPVTLVGHSYGGQVITEAGTDDKVTSLVFIAAFAPDAGESAGSLGASMEPAPAGAELRPDAHGFLKLTEAGISNDFAQDLTAAEKDVLFAVQGPTNAAALGTNVTRPAWASKPSWYLVATHDRAIQPDLQRMMATRINATTVEVAASHVAMMAKPDETAQLIVEALG
jgi:pimeloyl-ACP methyl ester carboxylesterase